MSETPTPEGKKDLKKYHLCFALCVLLGIIASAIELFGDSLGLSLMAIFYGGMVGAVTYIFVLCLMVLIGLVLRGKFGVMVSNWVCWILLLAAPILAWLVSSVTSARY